MKDAACRDQDPELFFPEKGVDSTPGKLVCLSCPVRNECRDYQGRTMSDYGMWGGEIVKRGAKRNDS